MTRDELINLIRTTPNVQAYDALDAFTAEHSPVGESAHALLRDVAEAHGRRTAGDAVVELQRGIELLADVAWSDGPTRLAALRKLWTFYATVPPPLSLGETEHVRPLAGTTLGMLRECLRNTPWTLCTVFGTATGAFTVEPPRDQDRPVTAYHALRERDTERVVVLAGEVIGAHERRHKKLVASAKGKLSSDELEALRVEYEDQEG